MGLVDMSSGIHFETSSAPTTLVERDKLDLSSLIPPKGEMESSFIVGHVLSRVPLQALYVLVNLHLESSTKKLISI